eukprot:TRINITY_DN32329_c0_g1_i1.p1 TRINITY_DN32329_c0_g1~~TRINITY_DN32329_c0_g1_i1.p1  ORF type:complete len:2934 (+),score=344.49 TRINITY_DN32329_c0_g1_i1:623-8803(+)
MENLPPGYRQWGMWFWNIWECDDGYYGESPFVNCSVADDCTVVRDLVGCDPVVPCAMPEYDECRYVFDNCSNLAPGETCEVTCRPPYDGNNISGIGITTASCPSTNVDPTYPFNWKVPICNLTCTDPNPLPRGYVWNSEFQVWDCDFTIGFIGEAIATCEITDDCTAITELSGCLELVPCALPDVDRCVFDLSNCEGLRPGRECQVSCRHPYVTIGDSTRATCPFINVDPDYVMEWTPPECDCQGPVPLPAGYGLHLQDGLITEDLALGLYCTSGYTGEVSVNCSVPDAPCLPEATLAGCIKTVPCEIPYFDPCIVSTSDCGSEVPPGSSCLIDCIGEYLGNGTQATCSLDNIYPTGLMIPDDWKCGCPDPDPVPPGYARTDDDVIRWTCAPGYIGEAVHSCKNYDNCTVEVTMSGCDKLMPCETLNSTCLYDSSNCSEVMAGQECEIKCMDPYVGTPMTGYCPSDNIDPTAPLIWSKPICNWTVCPAPTVGPNDTFDLNAYIQVPNFGWACNMGYGGEASESCPISEIDCSSETVLTGCLPVVGCIKPSADPCVYDTDDCDNTGPGEICILRCRDPFVGSPTGGLCQFQNTNPNRLIDWQKPRCKLVCPDPPNMTEGYIRNTVVDKLECIEGWHGTARSSCGRGWHGCEIFTTLSGCTKLQPCAVANIDPCVFDTSLATGLMGGESGLVSCKPPYVGTTSPASCPPFNFDPKRSFIFFPQKCYCPDPCPIPIGYYKSAPGYDNWVCDTNAGYIGSAELICSDGAECLIAPLLRGCQKLVPCAPLNVTRSRCDVNTTGCEAVSPGDSCVVQCAPPYTGGSVEAFCPSDNTDPEFEPVMPPLQCELETCRATDKIQEGYVKTSSGWLCNDGWAGDPQVYCSLGLEAAIDGSFGCGQQMHLTGCLPKQPCVPPESLEGCKYDTSGCGLVPPGSECRLLCRKPYSGLGIFAYCPDDNTNASQEVILPQSISLDCECPDPPADKVPPGYMRTVDGEWMCAVGFAGDAVKRCERPDACLEEAEFLGCLPLQPCVAPLDVDYCMYDVSQCEGVMPGHSCDITCVLPYQQDLIQNASCKVNNTDPTTTFDWDVEECELTWGDCVDPLPIPVGYEKTSNGFRCAPGYVGNTEVHCGAWEDCDTTPQVTGCFPVQPCQPVSFQGTENCMYDASACPAVLEPGAECELRCKMPYRGRSTKAMCSSENIVFGGAFSFEAPSCFCPLPDIVPEGYIVNWTGWFCDVENNYTGSADIVCSKPDHCLEEPIMEGCQKAGPCESPAIDPCMYDTSSCDGIEPNSQCVIGCKMPFFGSAATAFCNSPGGVDGLEWSLPFCVLDYCPDPLVFPAEGYVRNSSGWFCAEHWTGAAKKTCTHNRTCELTATLSGCRPVTPDPCSLPDLDECRYDLSSCKSIKPGQYCEVNCRLPYVGEATTAVCVPGNSSTEFVVEDLMFTRPYCDLERCPDPVPLPAGYKRRGDTYECMDSYNGKAVAYCKRLPNCKHEMVLSGCTLIEGIQQGFATLAAVQSWQSEVEDGVETCVPDEDCGWVPTGNEYAGYLHFYGDVWRCASGYTGKPFGQCRSKRICKSKPTLDGCVPIQACKPILSDACDLDVSDCTQVMGGESCEIRCKDPYTGPPTIATCPEGNVNTTTEMIWMRPSCQLTNCPIGVTVPDGFVKDSIVGWRCANGFQGKASVNCTITDACQVKCVSGGCDPIEICELPPTDSCVLDLTDCQSLLPGRACEVHCVPPYTGTSTSAFCKPEQSGQGPYRNETRAAFDWTQPECECADPYNPVAGYMKIDGEWRCAPGYFGEAIKRCQRPTQCLDEPELLGCDPLVPCADPPRSTGVACEPIDVSNCSQIMPGHFCEIRCIYPYVGAVSRAYCYDQNTDPDRPLDMPENPCSLGCDDPPELPWFYADHGAVTMGFVKHEDKSMNASWTCDVENRFVGKANVYCKLNNETCNSTKIFEGCEPRVRNCLAPALDSCKYDVSDCANVTPGESCTLRCSSNYVGESTKGDCPERNVDDAGLVFRPPRCVNEDPACPEPEVDPAGFDMSDDGYSCSPGHVGDGFITTRCGHNESCSSVIEVSGCTLAVPCAPPPVDPCERDNVACWQVAAGGSCELSCKRPFMGRNITATCPAGNTDPTRQLDWTPEACGCRDPIVTPPGYVQDKFGRWSCDEGYAGTATKQCRRGEECIAEPELLGCFPLQPCAKLVVDTCDQNVSDCYQVAPGGSCEVRCKSPWSTTETATGTCPGGNVDPFRQVDWLPAACQFRCPPPSPMPAGYAWFDNNATAYCGDGYVGQALTNCDYNETTCQVTTNLTGCIQKMPCKVPDVDPCFLNMTACRNVMPGEFCRPECLSPYSLWGDAAMLRCPLDNFDPDTELKWVNYPNCSMHGCLDPEPLPPGYEFGIDFRNPRDNPEWYCGVGFIGTPVRYCGTNSTCGSVGILEGCMPVVPCNRPKVDTCRVDDSQCSSTQPGGVCELKCRPPFEGKSTFPRCESANIDPDGLLYEEPRCLLAANFDPLPMEKGYASSFFGYECAVGYAGEIDMVCRMGAGCRTETYPVGCAPPVPCDVSGFQDTDGREGILAGNLVWGPAQLDPTANSGRPQSKTNPRPLQFAGRGVISEDEVHNYSVYFVDTCNRTMGGIIASLEPFYVRQTKSKCCVNDVYNVSLSELEIPQEATGLAVVVLIKSPRGIEPAVNYWVVPFEDRIDPITTGARTSCLVGNTLVIVLWLTATWST